MIPKNAFSFFCRKIVQTMDEVDIFLPISKCLGPKFIRDVQKCEKMPTSLHHNVHRQMLMVLFLLKDMMLKIISKCQNAGMLAKSQSVTGISTSSQLPQSGIGIPASRSVWYYWSRISPALSS